MTNRGRQEIAAIEWREYTHRDAQTSLTTQVVIKIENLWRANEEP